MLLLYYGFDWLPFVVAVVCMHGPKLVLLGPLLYVLDQPLRARFAWRPRLGWDVDRCCQVKTCQPSLIGGFEHFLFLILGIIIPTDYIIFFRGVETTNQDWFEKHPLELMSTNSAALALSIGSIICLIRYPGSHIWALPRHRHGALQKGSSLWGEERLQTSLGTLWKSGHAAVWWSSSSMVRKN